MASLIRAVLVGLATVAAAHAASAARENRLPSRVKAILDRPDQLELLSLEPGIQKRPSQDSFHGWRVLGRTPIVDPRLQAELRAAIERGIAESDGSLAACFEPRHGLQARSAKGIVDLVICFHCLQIEAYLDGEPADGALTTTAPQAVFDRILKSAKVPLAAH